jgi:ribosomal protein S18 acetylase RimI-like enzyme
MYFVVFLTMRSSIKKAAKYQDREGMITYRHVSISEVGKIAEIDRSEHVTLSYRAAGGRLEESPVDWQVPRWDLSGDGGHSVSIRVKGIAGLLEQGADMVGAFDGDLLVGFAVVCYRLRPGLAQLDALFVSREYRRQGIAEALLAEVIRLARLDGARLLYVSATPSQSAVGFYRSQGFEPAPEPLTELYALEPEDIHMIKLLDESLSQPT